MTMEKESEDVKTERNGSDKGFFPDALATGVGSMPHERAEDACRFVAETLTAAPFWPQLPQRSFKENMYAQYSEGFPGFEIDEAEKKMWVDTARMMEELEAFYEKVMEGDLETFAISPEYAEGLYRMPEIVNTMYPEGLPIYKGQVTGPVSMGLTITDEKRRAIIYNETAEDVVIKMVVLKAKWLEAHMRETVKAERYLMFYDEPYMVSFGSAYLNMTHEQVVGYLNECFEGVSCLTGVHCCGNTDWAVILDTTVDVVNFDAYEFGVGVTLYDTHLRKFIDRGGILAWGIVPTSEAALQEDYKSLTARLEGLLDRLVAKGFDKVEVLRHSMITPSCGTGSLPVELAEEIFTKTVEVSRHVQDLYL